MHQAVKVEEWKMGSKRNGAEKTETLLNFSIYTWEPSAAVSLIEDISDWANITGWDESPPYAAFIAHMQWRVSTWDSHASLSSDRMQGNNISEQEADSSLGHNK